ncbi:MAG: asparagine synthase (glutamine-hydrolyzing) [Acidobacteriaceae bacterium]|nr:asparagine synthase (glutamine-hydrolyzing) [Acidobacteriaceae bacterium]
MCGISGFLELNCASSADDLRTTAARMAEVLRHRGPDDSGVWIDSDVGIALSMSRLAILDLSPAGHQPMQSTSGRYVLVFNGEIYNFENLKNELSAVEQTYPFRSHSDTEVMLAAFERWGVDAAVVRFNGMFAFAVWDRRERTLTLGRDRFGEKPLYYALAGDTMLFGSELKALRAHPCFVSEIDREAVSLYLRYSCIPAPWSIYRNARKLLPASLLKVSASNLQLRPYKYWSLGKVIDQRTLTAMNQQDTTNQLDHLLRDAIRIRMRSDVPLGAFLSGGVDSSTVTSLMQAQSDKPVKTFSIGSHDREFNEATDAQKVARYLGTEHTELYITPEEIMSLLPLMPQIYDEPFADISQIPTLLVSRLAKRHVAVSLTGDGGDEIFGGYNRHVWGDAAGRLHHLPRFLRKVGARGVHSVAPHRWNLLFRLYSPATPARWRQRMPGYKLHKLASLVESTDSDNIYECLVSHWPYPEKIVSNATKLTAWTAGNHRPLLPHPAEEMMYLDTMGYLPDDILVKLDRATMAVSLEGRVPLLDHRVAEFAWSLPLDMRIRARQGKWILRQVLYRYVPRELVDRPKSGFDIPLASWLRGPLRDWAEPLLGEDRIRSDGYFHPEPILAMWREHLTGKCNWEYQLWDILMFQAWLDESRRQLAGSSIEAISNLTREAR